MMQRRFSLKSLLSVLALLAVVSHVHGQGARKEAGRSGALRITPVEDKLAPVGWKRYRFGEPVEFSVALPRPPFAVSEATANDERFASPAPIVYLAPSETAAYGVSYIDDPQLVPKLKTEEGRESFFLNYSAGLANGMKQGMQLKGESGELKLSPPRRVTIDGLSGFERDMAVGPLSGRVQAVVVGEKAYVVFAQWNTHSPEKERAAFFSSFKVNASSTPDATPPTAEATRAPADATRASAQSDIKMPPFSALDDASAPQGWKRYRFGESPVHFSIALPAKPEERAHHLPRLPTATAYTYIAETDPAYYAVVYVEGLPEEASGLTADLKERLYDFMWRDLASSLQRALEQKNIPLKLVAAEPKSVTVSGLAGREQDFSLGPFSGRARIVLAGRRAFMAFAAWTPDETAARRAGFFDSLEIHAKR